MKKIGIILLLFTAFGFSWNKSANTADPLPSLLLKNLDGKEVDIKELAKDKLTIIDCWATWCGPCNKELDNINDIYAEWKKNYNIQIIAISIDDSRNAMKVKPFIEGKKWPYIVLLDVNGDSRRTLGYQNPPYTVIVDKDGNIVYKHLGYTEGDEFELENKIKELKK